MIDLIYYLGSFPPPFGGVTVKNELICVEISKKINIRYDEEIKKWRKAYKWGLALLKSRQFVIGCATPTLFRLTSILNMVNKKAMARSIVMVMGGTMPSWLEKRANLIPMFSMYRHLYVETERMRLALRSLGLENVSVFPNCRKRPGREYSPAETGRQMRCVFFSLISPDKGSDLVLEAAKALPDVLFDFYGHIEPGYEEPFRKQIDGLPNAVYHGLFKTEGENVYDKLHEYDLLILPTKCKTEGVPGVLVEAKIAAVPAVVSDIAYNAEIIEDGRNGTVLSSNDAAALTQAIARLDVDRETLYHLKTGAKTSAEQYYIETYLPEILGMLEEKE